MFCLDLDELDAVVKNNIFISRNRFNLFNFRDRDHLQVSGHCDQANVREQIVYYLGQNNVDTQQVGRIMLVTNLCTLGYQFNPVSFYFCYDMNDRPLCAVAEVCNTFHEMKLYFLGKDKLSDDTFTSVIPKLFYVSPFIAMDTDFEFDLAVPHDTLNIRINDYKNGRLFFRSTLNGKKKMLTNGNVLRYALQFPFVTIKIITLIHWQALRLWFRKVAWYRKASFLDLQRDVLRPHKSLIK